MTGFPHDEEVREIVDLVRDGLFRNPRPKLAHRGLKVIHDIAEQKNYIHASPNAKVGHRFDWRELLDKAGAPHDPHLFDRQEEFIDAHPGVHEHLNQIMEIEIGPALDALDEKLYTNMDIEFIYGTIDHILFCRAIFGRSLHFIERLVEIYRLGGHPCGWIGSYPEGEMVAFFPNT